MLTARERDVLALISTGHSNREIAMRLHISEYTAKDHVENLLRKMEARNRSHAVALGFRSKVIA